MKRILILGGGISGLSAAWVAKQKYPHAKITLLEKSDRLGGALQTIYRPDFLFEKGPRTFQTAKCPYLLRLIREVGIEEEIIFSTKSASTRYLWERGALKPLNSFWPILLYSCLKEPFIPISHLEDESIYDFAARRFSPSIAETFFDPMTLGIYAGDIRKLSIRSCFPQLFFWEKEKGSCIKGAFPYFFKKKSSSLFTLKRGMESLITALIQKLNIEICLHTEVQAIEGKDVITSNQTYFADLIVSALPGSIISSLTHLSFPIQESSLWVTNLCYPGNVLPVKGFGYLVPSKEKENLLGVIWNSSIFPQQSASHLTCLTAMTRKENFENLKKTLELHLSISSEPIFVSSYLAEKAVPQFEVGYSNHLSRFQQEIQKKFPNLILLGNFLKSPSVESCISNAFKLISHN